MDNPINVVQPSLPPFEEYVDEIRQIWDSVCLTNNGPIHHELEIRLKDFLQVENLELFVNGHLALEIVISLMNLSGEVITTPFTFSSTTHAIVRNRLTPVFCDISPGDLNIDADKIEELITEKTSAIVPVHIFGNPCDVAKIDKIASKHNLKVIYDAAQAFGVTIEGKGIGTFGDASMISMHATKSFHTIEGGVVTFRDNDMKEKLARLRNFGFVQNNGADIIGLNAKMNEFQAAMGICNLRHYNKEIAKRKLVYERYKDNLRGAKGIQILPEKENITNNYTYFLVIIDPEVCGKNRDEICELLNSCQVYPRKYFAPLIVDYDCYRHKYGDSDIPVARYIADSILALPMYANLTFDNIDRICTSIRNM
jgi:dTDP-4-amino-4,6-dideoxygalactose transaminase